MARPETWSIIVDDVRFRLDRVQLYLEPSSYLVNHFLNAQGQSTRTEMIINGEPALWKLIQTHLRGYEILPLKDGAVPYLSKEATLASLNTIAISYGFANLQRKLQLEITTTRPKKYRLLVRVSFWCCDRLWACRTVKTDNPFLSQATFRGTPRV
ncbi:hypothetical protein FRC14_001799 [Serendipita sp. 396]|nr:hypothetical protein FRC14_001799 [Serendipita sp. 396]KAG8769189.1 hypothetical protein FRC15_004731 [Serendipita sp. 397]KAG8835868.1 hypothetical protein FRC20_007164 [Serendipita sp. 405]